MASETSDELKAEEISTEIISTNENKEKKILMKYLKKLKN